MPRLARQDYGCLDDARITTTGRQYYGTGKPGVERGKQFATPSKWGEKPRGETMINKTVCGISFVALAGVLALAPMIAAQSSYQAASKNVTITGTVTCSKYVNSRPERKGFTGAEAIRLCASQGYPYVIVSGKNVYPLEGDKTQMAKLAGEKVTVTGHVDTDRPERATEAYQGTVAASTIVPATN
jgi:hypothetical protein